MRGPPFDPSRAVTFDLAHGIVLLEGAPPRVLVPADALARLCEAAGADQAAAVGRAIGEAMGRRVASRFSPGGEGEGGAAVRAASIEVVVDHLGGELALAGLGQLGIERWGRALVMVVDQSPLGAPGDALLGAALAEAVGAATGRPVRAGLLARDGARARFLLAGEAAIDRVRSLLQGGASWGDALMDLHAPRGDA